MKELLQSDVEWRPLHRLAWLERRFSRDLSGEDLRNTVIRSGSLICMAPRKTRTYSTYCHSGKGDSQAVPIARPISNTRDGMCWTVVCRWLRWGAGELYIAVLVLARGYLRRSGLTAERLWPTLWGRGDADVPDRNLRVAVRWRCWSIWAERPAGEGAGFRIELGEIESSLQRQAGVCAAVVVLREARAGRQSVGACVGAGPRAAPPPPAPRLPAAANELSHLAQLDAEPRTFTCWSSAPDTPAAIGPATAPVPVRYIRVPRPHKGPAHEPLRSQTRTGEKPPAQDSTRDVQLPSHPTGATADHRPAHTPEYSSIGR